MSEAIADSVLGYHRRRLRRRKVGRVTIDLDPTDTPTYGGQQLAYTAILRSGHAPASHGAIGLLRMTIERIKRNFPGTRIRIRLDGGFANPRMLDFLEAQRVEYLVSIGKKPVVERRAGRLMGTARRHPKSRW